MTEQERIIEKMKPAVRREVAAMQAAGITGDEAEFCRVALAALRADPGLARYLDATPEQRAAVDAVLKGDAVVVPLKGPARIAMRLAMAKVDDLTGDRYRLMLDAALAASPHAIPSGAAT